MRRLTALRRGLGRGFLLAARGGANDEVMSCVLKDPRWDGQIDDRASYYAQLLISGEVDWRCFTPVLQVFAESPQLDYRRRRLVLEVLAQAAWRGQDNAADLLAQYFPNPLLLEDIRGWLFAAGGADLLASVVGKAQLGFFDLEPPRYFPDEAPGPQESTEKLLSRLEQPGARSLEMVSERATTDELLAYREKAGLHGYAKVLRLLGKRGFGDLIVEARAALLQPDLKPMKRRAYIDYLVALPATITLPLARDWLHNRALYGVAHLILAKQAELEDLPLLHVAVPRALRRDDQSAVCSFVEALDRLAQPQSLELLAYCYEQMTYSFGRTFVVKALGKYRAQPLARTLLEESLWDAQATVRARACELTWNPQRLGQFMSDPFEDPAVKQDAERALLGGAPYSRN